MKIQIHSEHTKLTDEQEVYITKKIMSLKKYCEVITDQAVQVKVNVDRQKGIDQKRKVFMTVTMTVPHKVFRAEFMGITVEEAVDELHAKLETQIEKYKSKLLDRSQRVD